MGPDEIKNHIIHGYTLLTAKQRSDFEQTVAGKAFIELTTTYFQTMNQASTVTRILNWLYWEFSFEKEAALEPIEEEQKNLIQKFSSSTEYKTLTQQIILKILTTEIQDFCLLTNEQQEKIADASFSKALQPIGDDNCPATTKKNLIQQWKEQLANQAYYQECLQEIKNKKATKHVQELTERTNALAKFIPLIAPYAHQLIDYYAKHIGDKEFNSAQLEVSFLSQIIAHNLQSASECFECFISKSKLNEFNHLQANAMAQYIIGLFPSHPKPNLIELLRIYKQNLVQFIHDSILSIHDKKPPSKTERDIEKFTTSCKDWLWNNSILKESNKYFDEFGDSFIFLTQTGFISQKDGFIINLLELKKANQFQEGIKESRSIFAKIVSPLTPLWDEFTDISQHEKSKLGIFVRSISPVLIALGFIIGVTVLLNPLAIPEVIVAVVIIPVLIYAGLGLAAAYCSFKNRIFNYFKQHLAGGSYEIEEFQINERLVNGFGTQEKAKSVRKYYVDELIKCDQLESKYALQENQKNDLTTTDIEFREQNLERRYKLGVEWHRLSHDGKLGCDMVKESFLNRLRADMADEVKRIEMAWTKYDEPTVNTMTEKAINELVPRFTNSAPPANTTTATKYYPTLFRPVSLGVKGFAEQIDDLACRL